MIALQAATRHSLCNAVQQRANGSKPARPIEGNRAFCGRHYPLEPCCKVYGFTQDITQRKQIEKAKRAGELHLRNVLNNMIAMIGLMTPGGILIEANQTALKVANLKQHDVFGLPLEESYWWSWSSEEQARLREAIRLAAAGIFSRYDVVLRIGEGEFRTIDFMLSPMLGSDGRVVYLIPSAVDITERKQAEQALQKNKERLELLADVAEKLLRSEDPQAIIEDVCRAVPANLDCQFFFNYLVDGPDQNLVLNAFAGIAPEDAARHQKLDSAVSLCTRAARDRQRIIVENIQHNDDPQTLWARGCGVQAYRCHPLKAQENVLGTLSFATTTRNSFSSDEIALMKSVSDQVAVAIQRVQAEKMLQQLNKSLMQQVAERTALAEGRAKQLQSLAVELIEAEEKERQRIALLLHDDLQQLLASANMQLQVVRKSMPQDIALDSIEKLLSESISKSRHLSHELSPPVLQHSGIVAALRWLIRKMQEKFALTIQYRADAVERFDDATSKLLIFRAVQELLFNIVKHSEVKKAGIDLCKSDSSLVICVSDEGKGFDPSILGDAKQWTGLGLVSLRERIKVMRQALVKLLSGQSAIQVVGEASDGRQAFELARQLKPDIALMDISMPEMDGIEATRSIKAEIPEVRVIGLSMFEDEQAIQAMHNAGADGYVSKTASTSEQLKAIYCAAGSDG